jgi:hypothetical protein
MLSEVKKDILSAKKKSSRRSTTTPRCKCQKYTY